MHPLETYLNALAEVRASAAGTKETSYYPALHGLLNEVGGHFKPKVRCILQLANRGAGNPDGGLYTADQFQKLGDQEPIAGQKPARGAIEVKGAKDDAWLTADSEQVTKYWNEYGQVLVTNYRDFVLVGRDADGKSLKLASYRLASDEKAFWKLAGHPRKAAQDQGDRFIDFLRLVTLSPAVISAPRDVAWVLAYYAREAKARVEAQADLEALATIRTALEQALGLKFEGKKGEHFFRSTLVQTVFYGVFSAWVLWSKQHSPTSRETFNWRLAQWSLKVPMIRALFEQVATPGQLGSLGLIEVLDWTAAALNRVDRTAFFTRFQEQEAVQYFYEPFLEAFDPELRKELGVWYTPVEIVKYMVARIDRALREELGLEDGLADENVYVLDPGCGTGAYLVEVLNSIAATLKEKGADALAAQQVKKAARERIFGFEILPAPFVISHLQLGLLLQNQGAPLEEGGSERVAVYLTNSLTGWEPPTGPKQHLIFPEMEAERDAAEKVKQRTKILVIVGNPPYNGFAGVDIAEEHAMTDAYRTVKRAPAPQGQGLKDLYVRFYRIAERKIVEDTGSGIVCLISNYSWLDGLSHTGMRERFLEVFDSISIDSLNGDKFKTGKLTPDGAPDPSAFSTEQNTEGIGIGTAISLLLRRPAHSSTQTIAYRDFWGKTKRSDLLRALTTPEEFPYAILEPSANAGFPFLPHRLQACYYDWPTLPEIFPVRSPGVNTSRDAFLVDIDRENLERRLDAYFDPEIGDDQMRQIAPDAMRTTKRFDAAKTRTTLQRTGRAAGGVVPYEYRPFDTVHLYWHPETKLLDEKREDLFDAAQSGTVFLTSRQKRERDREGTPFYFTRQLADRHLTRPGSICFPLELPPPKQQMLPATGDHEHAVNLSATAREYLSCIGVDVHEGARELWFHVLASGYAPAYLKENEDGLRQDWPRIPLPSTLDALNSSATLGAAVAGLLDTTNGVKEVTTGSIRTELRSIGNFSLIQGRTLNASEDLKIEAGWGHPGQDGVTMPGKGRLIERDYSDAERRAIADGAAALGLTGEVALLFLGESTCDVYLNDRTCWSNIPVKIWEYTIGGYQVIKKWLSYREFKLLGRAITPDEAHYVRDMARRIAAICLLQPKLDANYAAVKAAPYAWPAEKPKGEAANV